MAAAAFVARLLPSETDVPVTPGMNPEEEKLLEAEEQHEVARQKFCRRNCRVALTAVAWILTVARLLAL